jgi:hypothetical protein
MYLQPRWSQVSRLEMRLTSSAISLVGGSPAGGAIDLRLGRQTREQVDLDVATLRKNQRIFWRRLETWDLHLVTAPDILEPWRALGTVPPPLHAVRTRSRAMN